MTVTDVIVTAKNERGISVAELSRRTGIKYEALRTALEGARNINAAELVSLCQELNLDISDFTTEKAGA